MVSMRAVAPFLVFGLGAVLQGCGSGGGGNDNSDLIPSVVTNNKDLSTLVTALKDADLDGALSADGPFTVFAPKNEAFDAIPSATLQALLNNKTALTTVLKYHVASGALMSTDLKNGSNVTTLEGHVVNVTIHKLVGGTVVKINDATVTTADQKASNGVVHVIDKVLLPPGFVLPKPPAPPSPPPSPSTCNAKIMVDSDCDTGKDMLSKSTKSQEECCSLCASTKNCKAWSWNKDIASDPTQLCFVKATCTDQAKKIGVVSGIMNPAPAPTPPAPPAPPAPPPAKKEICTVCQHIYDPMKDCGGKDAPTKDCGKGLPFEQLPAGWKCPVCGQGANKYKPMNASDGTVQWVEEPHVEEDPESNAIVV